MFDGTATITSGIEYLQMEVKNDEWEEYTNSKAYTPCCALVMATASFEYYKEGHNR